MNNWKDLDSDPLKDLIEYIKNRQPVFEPIILPKWLTDRLLDKPLPPRIPDHHV